MAIAGRVAIVPKGNWSDIIQYEKLDLVYHLGSSYLAKQRSIGIDPTNEDFWMLIVTGTSDEQINILTDQLEALDLEVDEVKTEVSNVKEDIANYSKKSTKLNLTIPASGWTGEKPATNTIAVEGATATNNIEVVTPDSLTEEQVTAFISAQIINGTQADGTVTLNAWGEVPSIDLPVTVIVRGD